MLSIVHSEKESTLSSLFVQIAACFSHSTPHACRVSQAGISAQQIRSSLLGRCVFRCALETVLMAPANRAAMPTAHAIQ